ncbi:MAG: glutamate 5-kinase [Proteobacteria bacterium]|nr:glutamate 5-kinase [Pseudomonadota bacterium]
MDTEQKDMENASQQRRQALAQARRIVLKIGSAVLTNSEDKSLDRGVFCRLIEMVSKLRRDGRDVIIVTSGAIALGRSLIGCERPDREKSLPTLQALAAIGQSLLMDYYERELQYYGLRCAQLLLTRADLEDRTRFSNARRSLEALLEMNVIPIINENDAVTCDQIRFGDNDTLSARVAVLCRADLLIIMSDIDAVYTDNPKINPDAVRIESIDAFDERLDEYAGDSSGDVGTGGMITKISASRMAAKMGVSTLILQGKRPKYVLQALEGKSLGTLLFASEHRQTLHKVWLESLMVKGKIQCDDGARQAICMQGRSLLPKGIVDVDGRFAEGEAVELIDKTGSVFAKGLALYDADDIRKLAGHHSSEIEAILGFHISDVIVHRDDLVLI